VLVRAGGRCAQAASAQAQTLPVTAERAPQAQTPFQPSGNAIAELAALTYDGYRDIRFNADSTLLARRQAAF
jgi:glucan biosynthesis protein